MHGAWPTFSESITLCLCTRTIKENENTHIYFYTTMQLKKQYNIEVSIRVFLKYYRLRVPRYRFSQ